MRRVAAQDVVLVGAEQAMGTVTGVFPGSQAAGYTFVVNYRPRAIEDSAGHESDRRLPDLRVGRPRTAPRRAASRPVPVPRARAAGHPRERVEELSSSGAGQTDPHPQRTDAVSCGHRDFAFGVAKLPALSVNLLMHGPGYRPSAH